MMNYEEYDYVQSELRKRNLKTFGSLERCRARLQRFLDAENKTVNISTLPTTDEKVIHIDEDTLEVANILLTINDNSTGDLLSNAVDAYRLFLIKSNTIGIAVDEYMAWQNAHREFIKNGFISIRK